MGVSTTYEHSPGLFNGHASLKSSRGLTSSCRTKPTVHKRPQHRLPLIKRRPRVVRFNIEANQVQETERIAPDSKSTLFWTRDERDDILESNQRLAREFRHQQPLSVEKANLVFDRCCQDHVTDDSSDEDDSNDLYDDDEDEHDELEVQDTLAATGSQTIELPTQVRGLEWGFLPASKKYRRTHVQRVLRWQRCIETGDNKARMISARAIRSSRPSRVMARILGASDAASAKNVPVTRRTRCRMLPSWW
jgi:hypothetical protein